MRSLAWLALAALPAFAQDASEFRSHAPIALDGRGDGLYRLTVPREVFRDAKPDLSDVRIFNRRGDAVPFTWAGDVPVKLETSHPMALPVFPVSSVAAGTEGAEVTVRASDGTLVEVRGKRPPAKGATPPAAAYLLDAMRTTEPVRALAFHWKAGPGTEMVPVHVEASEDLKGWTPLATGALVQVASGANTLLQPRVEFGARKGKYFRVTSSAPGFELVAANAEYEPRGVRPARQLITLPGAGGTAGEQVWDLGARLPLEAVRLLPAEPNSVLVATLYTRDSPDGAWRLLANAPFYRLQVEGKTVSSPLLEIGRRPVRYLRAQFAAGSSVGAPTLEAFWSGTQLLFAAQGEEPFRLVFGNPRAQRTALSIDAMLPRSAGIANARLGEAAVGPVKAGPPPSRFERLVGETSPRRVALCAILIGGVAALAWMAWRLSKQMGARPPT